MEKQSTQPREHFEKSGLEDLDLFGRRNFDLHLEKNSLLRKPTDPETPPANTASKTGVVDSAATNELNAVRSYLDTIDTTSRSGDKQTPCDVRLQQILSSYGQNVKSNVGQVVACGREIHKATEELVSVAENQADSVEQTTSIVEQLLAHLLTSCDGADQTREATQNAQVAATAGVEQFESLLDEMKQI